MDAYEKALRTALAEIYAAYNKAMKSRNPDDFTVLFGTITVHSVITGSNPLSAEPVGVIRGLSPIESIRRKLDS